MKSFKLKPGYTVSIAFIWVIDAYSIYEFNVIVVWLWDDTVWVLHVLEKGCIIKHMDILYATLFSSYVCFVFVNHFQILSLIRLLDVV